MFNLNNRCIEFWCFGNDFQQLSVIPTRTQNCLLQTFVSAASSNITQSRKPCAKDSGKALECFDIFGTERRESKLLQQHIFHFCKQNRKSRRIQAMLSSLRQMNDAEEVKQKLWGFYHNIEKFALHLSIDTHGHYVIAKFLDLCFDYEASSIIKKFFANFTCDVTTFTWLMSHSYPYRILQNVLASTDAKLSIWALETLIQVLFSIYHEDIEKNHYKLLDFINSAIGNMVVQDIIKRCCQFCKVTGDQTWADSLSNLFANYMCEHGNCNSRNLMYEIATNKYGCRVVQCIVENVDLLKVRKIFDRLYAFVPVLSNHPFGNYIIQKCIIHGDEVDMKYQFTGKILLERDISVQVGLDIGKEIQNKRLIIKRAMLPRYLDFAAQNAAGVINFGKFAFGKYSSNVCDIAFKNALQSQRSQLLRYLTKSKCSTDTVLFGLIHHKFGNFVIKNILNFYDKREDDTAACLVEYLNKAKTFVNASRQSRSSQFSFAKTVLTIAESQIQKD